MDNATIYNVYCDESCHLENDHNNTMVIGAIWCPSNRVKEIFKEIREIKRKHNLNEKFEIKWTKVSPAKIDFFKDLVEYFFKNNEMFFRALVVKDKQCLSHGDFEQDHDTWYYKMYFHLLNRIFSTTNVYRIYVDIKATHSGAKIKNLHNILCNNMYDFSRNIVEKIQPVRSHEVEILQLTDLFIGALSYLGRKLNTSQAKLSLIEQIRTLSHYTLEKSTLLKEEKFNLFFWTPQNQKGSEL